MYVVFKKSHAFHVTLQWWGNLGTGDRCTWLLKAQERATVATFTPSAAFCFYRQSCTRSNQAQFQKRILAHVLHPHKWKQYSHSFQFSLCGKRNLTVTTEVASSNRNNGSHLTTAAPKPSRTGDTDIGVHRRGNTVGSGEGLGVKRY